MKSILRSSWSFVLTKKIHKINLLNQGPTFRKGKCARKKSFHRFFATLCIIVSRHRHNWMKSYLIEYLKISKYQKNFFLSSSGCNTQIWKTTGSGCSIPIIIHHICPSGACKLRFRAFICLHTSRI